jgi:hypothetical protein
MVFARPTDLAAFNQECSIGQGEEFSIGRPMLEKWIDNGGTD